MIRALIIEDEKPAAEYLQRILGQVDIKIEISFIIPSVEEAVAWFSNNPMPDLIFLDIQLSDGLSFEIFDHVDIICPVIFTTAYEEYAIKAFKFNGIDYLLKPVSLADLKHAIDRFVSSGNNLRDSYVKILRYKVDQVMKTLTNKYKSRFVVNVGIHLKAIETGNINLFFSLEKSTFILENTGKTYDINYSLEQVEKLVDPAHFNRISRKYIVNIDAITDIISYSGTRLKLKVSNSRDDDILVSRSKISEFRKWLER
ncbi:MAG: LytTR family DNA-binding domain-containing protein [Bacteroidota bacterium]